MIYEPVPSALIEFINRHQRFLLLSHVSPDGDCLASSLALGNCLQRMGKQAEYFNPGPLHSKDLQHLEQHFSLHLPENISDAAVIILDCSLPERIGNFAESITSLPTAVVDHHSSADNDDYGDVRFINPSAPSASLLVQQIIEALGQELSREEAEYIFFAFATDTGFFRFLGAQSQETFKLLAKLTEVGVSPKQIHRMISGTVSLESRKYLGKLLARAEPYFDGRFLFTWASLDEVNSIDPSDRDSANLYQQLMNVHNVDILLVLWEKERSLIMANIRTSDHIDAGQLAAKYGGGGHARAAGFTANISLKDLFTKIKADIAGFF